MNPQATPQAQDTPLVGTVVLVQTAVLESTRVVGPKLTEIAPLLTPTAATPQPVSGALTLENAEKGAALHVGETLTLTLGNRGWRFRVGDPTIVKRISDPGGDPDAPVVFQALRAGQTLIYATSDPPCRQSTPPCMMPTLLVQIPVIVAE